MPMQQRFGHETGVKGGPRWQDWDSIPASRFFRDGQPVDILPDESEPIAYKVEGRYFWGGLIQSHFGHQIADFSTRIAQIKYYGVDDAKLIFISNPGLGIKSYIGAPQWFKSILKWYGYGEEDIEIIKGPTHFRKLNVFPQGEALKSVGPSSEYLDALDYNLRRKKIRIGKKIRFLYVSRAGLHTCMAGESYLERQLLQAGVTVIRPEELRLRSQLRHYLRADTLIFSEGSAIHGLQLLGRGIGAVHILNRRWNFKMARAAIEPRAQMVQYQDRKSVV